MHLNIWWRHAETQDLSLTRPHEPGWREGRGGQSRMWPACACTKQNTHTWHWHVQERRWLDGRLEGRLGGWRDGWKVAEGLKEERYVCRLPEWSRLTGPGFRVVPRVVLAGRPQRIRMQATANTSFSAMLCYKRPASPAPFAPCCATPKATKSPTRAQPI